MWYSKQAVCNDSTVRYSKVCRFWPRDWLWLAGDGKTLMKIIQWLISPKLCKLSQRYWHRFYESVQGGDELGRWGVLGIVGRVANSCTVSPSHQPMEKFVWLHAGGENWWNAHGGNYLATLQWQKLFGNKPMAKIVGNQPMAKIVWHQTLAEIGNMTVAKFV